MTTVPDGRQLRGVTNKAKLLQAALALIKQGNWRPDVGDIAAGAGLSLRTFFTHFHNLDNFYEELLATHETSLLHEGRRYSPETIVQIMLRGRVPT